MFYKKLFGIFRINAYFPTAIINWGKTVMQKFLPIGISNFKEMIRGNFVYVDKTQYIYEMVRIPQAFYFLSRPRRFGKSLLVSTLKSLFEGKRELFKDLWINQTDWNWEKKLVIVFDFNQISSDTPENLKTGLRVALNDFGQLHGIKLKHELLKEKFKELVVNLKLKSGDKIIILVDEYDKPIIEHIGRGEKHLKIAELNRDILKQFFGVLKGIDVSAALRLVFITGISKFSGVSIFSDLNNLDDLSMKDSYADLSGYTEGELKKYFDGYVNKLATALNIDKSAVYNKIKEWYNGYRFSDRDINVFNPFSVINLLSNDKFKNYWFETATPSFLVNLIKEKQYPVPEIETLKLEEISFSAYDIDYLKLEPLLFQTGYITIRGIEENLYKLGYPNQEVKVAFLDYLYEHLVEVVNPEIKEKYVLLNKYLDQEETEQFIATVNIILSSIPYQHIYDQDEHYYHTAFYLMLSASGALVHTEVHTSIGRIDLEVHFRDKIYIIELKCNQAAEKAIEQIKEKKYFEKHLTGNRKIFLLGINFDTEARRISEWKLENL